MATLCANGSASLCGELRGGRVVPDPFHVFEEHLLTTPIIEFRGPAVGVAGDSLGRFKGAVIL